MQLPEIVEVKGTRVLTAQQISQQRTRGFQSDKYCIIAVRFLQLKRYLTCYA